MKDNQMTMTRSEKYPRLTARGAEKLDPKPKAAYINIDPVTGEVTGDMPRPRSLMETLAAATGRHHEAGWHEGDEDDDDFDADIDDGSLPSHTPHTEGFVDAMGLPVDKAVKTLQKRGVALFKTKSKPSDKADPSANPENRPAPQKAGGPSPETAEESA